MTSHDAAVEIVALNLFEIADRCCEVITRTMVQWRTNGTGRRVSAALSMMRMDRDELGE